jgi:hypothetical protein
MLIEKKLNQMKTGPSRIAGERRGFQKGLEAEVRVRADKPLIGNDNDNGMIHRSGNHVCPITGGN